MCGPARWNAIYAYPLQPRIHAWPALCIKSTDGIARMRIAAASIEGFMENAHAPAEDFIEAGAKTACDIASAILYSFNNRNPLRRRKGDAWRPNGSKTFCRLPKP